MSGQTKTSRDSATSAWPTLEGSAIADLETQIGHRNRSMLQRVIGPWDILPKSRSSDVPLRRLRPCDALIPGNPNEFLHYAAYEITRSAQFDLARQMVCVRTNWLVPGSAGTHHHVWDVKKSEAETYVRFYKGL